jgi:hypothetical protein
MSDFARKNSIVMENYSWCDCLKINPGQKLNAPKGLALDFSAGRDNFAGI